MDNCNLAISIPQDDCTQGLDFPIPISGLNNTNLGSNVELTEARIIISHTWELDLRIYLRSPSGKRIPLSIENGTSADNTSYGNINVPACEAHTSFTMDPCLDLQRIDDPSIGSNFTGKFLPEGDFADFNGEDPNGIWYIEVCDKDAAANLGRLEYADLIFTEIHCDAPTNVEVSSINNSSITVSWDPIQNTVLTIIEVVPHGASPSTGETSQNGNIFLTNNISSSTALELQEDTPYDIYVRTKCPNGEYSKNSCAVFVQTACATQAVTISNNFDNQTLCQTSCGSSCNINGLWNNVNYDDFDWYIGSGANQGVNSGPSADVSGNGKYAFIKTDNLNCQFNKSAILESTCLQISASQNSCHMSFYFHSYGNSLGSLRLEILPQGSQVWTELWRSSGTNEDNWFRRYIDLRPYDGQNVKMRFVSSGATGNSSNLALDEIVFYGAQQSGSPSFVHYRDRDNDGYGNENEPLALCSSIPPAGFVSVAGDCDDTNPNISPIAEEIGCNGIDENCNGMLDDNMVSNPIAFYQELCSGQAAQVEVFGTQGFETNWYSDQAGLNLIGQGNPVTLNLESGFQNIYARNILRNGPGLRITEVNYLNPYHLEIQSIGEAQNYQGWKIYVNSVLNGSEINDFNSSPWNLSNMENGEIQVRSRTDWTNPILWPKSRPGWVMLVDPLGEVQDAIFWNWSDTEMASININLEGRTYTQNNIPWQGSAINVGNCEGTISLHGSVEQNSSHDYECLNIGSIGESNPNLFYETVCASNLTPVTVNVIQSPVVDFVLDNDPCDNGSISSGIELLIDDGVGPFIYQWSNGSSEQNQNNLAPGDYNVTIIGGNGCHTILENITIGTNSSSLGVYTSEVHDVSCFGAADGVVIVEVDGGAPPFQFNWIVGVARDDVYNNRDTLQGLEQGQYAVTVTDNNGCVSSTSFEVAQPNEVSISVSTQLPSCQSSFDGFINIQTEGGNAPYSYQWSNGRTTSNNLNLSFGEYAVTITDDSDCILVSDPILFSPSNDTISLLSLHVEQVECANSNTGFIETSFDGGVGALTYQWDNGSISPNLYELEPGSYSLTVTDENLCEFYLQNVNIAQPLSSALSLTFNSTNASCNGVCDGVVSTNITGGDPPYTYHWSTGDSTATIFNLCAGAIGLTITDEIGCQQIFDSEIFIDSETTDMQSQNIVDSLSCFNSTDGVIDANVNGGIPPYNYSWNFTDANTEVVVDLGPGLYECTITDNAGCIIELEPVLIERPAIINLDSIHIENSSSGMLEGSIEIFLSGGRGDFEIMWFDANEQELGTGFLLDDIGIGNYSFIATDSGGCEFERRNIVVELTTTVLESNLLSTFDLAPNPTSTSIQIDIKLDQAIDMSMRIYSASGQLVYKDEFSEQDNLLHRLNVSTYPAGVYFLGIWSRDEFVGRRSFVVE